MIRRVDPGECAGDLRDVYLECFGAPPWNEGSEEANRFVARMLADPTYTVLAGLDGGRVTSFVATRPTPLPLPADRAYPKIAAALGDGIHELLADTIEVDELAVRPDHRGTGLGRALLAEVSAATAGRCWIITGVQASGAREFYRRAGWREVARSETGTQDVVVLLPPAHPALERARPS